LKNNFMKLSTIVALVVASASAHAAPRFGLFGFGNYPLYSATVLGNDIKGTFGGGGGALINFRLGNSVGLEIGAAYQITRLKTGPTGGATTTTSAKSVHAPVLLDIALGKNGSFLLGGYYDHSLETGGEADYGANVGFRIMPTSMLFFDGRFGYGFKKDSLDKNRMGIQLVAGLMFGKGGK
jgi:hypothetical protein